MRKGKERQYIEELMESQTDECCFDQTRTFTFSRSISRGEEENKQVLFVCLISDGKSQSPDCNVYFSQSLFFNGKPIKA